LVQERLPFNSEEVAVSKVLSFGPVCPWNWELSHGFLGLSSKLRPLLLGGFAIDASTGVASAACGRSIIHVAKENKNAASTPATIQAAFSRVPFSRSKS
jgi:hypothetical protein